MRVLRPLLLGCDLSGMPTGRCVVFFSQPVKGSFYAVLMLTPPSTAQVWPVT